MRVIITATGEETRVVNATMVSVGKGEVFIHEAGDQFFADRIGVVDLAKYRVTVEEETE